jgi:hypothetical protein
MEYLDIINHNEKYFADISLFEDDSHEFFHLGFHCLMERSHAKSWCGYVLLPKEHDYYGVSWDIIPASVHGGITYTEFFNQNGNLFWKIGFDCAHIGDHTIYSFDPIAGKEVYRTKDYVIDQVKSLAHQMNTKRWNRYTAISKIA